MATGLAAGILLDATIIRALLVPAAVGERVQPHGEMQLEPTIWQAPRRSEELVDSQVQRVDVDLRGASGPAQLTVVGPVPMGAGVGVGTRWEQIVSPRGSLCPLVSPRNLSLCREFLMERGIAGR